MGGSKWSGAAVLVIALWTQKPRRELIAWGGWGLLRHQFAATFPPMAALQHTISIRVRYPEVDAMGYLHHSRYFQYFEMGRVELLRSMGHSYADLEKAGIFFAVVKVDCRYRAPARYDEELTLTTRIVKQTTVRIDHEYQLRRGETILAEASTTIACVNKQGELQPIPEFLRSPH